MKEIKVEQLKQNVFDAIGKQWTLVAASADGKTNAMTASWGGMGVIWNKNVVFLFIRPQRYTKTFIDKSSTLSLSFFAEEYRDMLTYMGKVSGRDEDKIAKANLTLTAGYDAPVFKEAELTFVCKKLYSSVLSPDGFYDKKIIPQCYPDNDYHEVYVAEIEKILVNND